MKTIVRNLFEIIQNNNLLELNNIIHDECLLINYDNKSVLGKEKVIKLITEKRKDLLINKINILNSVQDSIDTMLVSYTIIISNINTPIFGSAVIRVKDMKINYIKNFIVK